MTPHQKLAPSKAKADVDRTSERVEPIRRHRIARLANEFLWVGAGQGAAALGGILSVRCLTSLLAPAAYGQVALGLTLASLTQMAMLGPLGNAVLRFYSLCLERNTFAVFRRALYRVVAGAFMVHLLVYLLALAFLWAVNRMNWAALAASAIAYSFLSGACSMADGIQNAARQRTIVAIHQGLGQWVRLGAAAVLLMRVRRSSTVAIAGFALGSGVTLVSQICFIRRRLAIATDQRDHSSRDEGLALARQMRSYAWPFAVWGILLWSRSASERWALSLFRPLSEVGLYQTLTQIGYAPILLLSAMFAQLITPIIFKLAGPGTDSERLSRSRDLTRYLVYGILALTGIATAIAAAIHPLVFRALTARGYRSVSGLLPLCLASGGIFAAGQTVSLAAMSQFNSRAIMVPTISAAAVGTALNVLGAYEWGVRGVVLANLAFSTFYLIAMIYATPLFLRRDPQAA